MSLTSAINADPAIDSIWNDSASIQAMLDVEAALTRACAHHGLIPAAAAESIAACCQARLIDTDLVRTNAALGGNCAIPLVKQLTAAVRERSEEAAGYVHWGATSQDVIDTAAVLQIKKTLGLMRQSMDELARTLAMRALQERKTIMAGRTLLQQAVPITLGMKFAQWLDALERHLQRLDQLEPRVLSLQFGGAAGTLASLGAQAEPVRDTLASMLDLQVAPACWHTHRDRVLEAASWMAMLVAMLAKIARDISLMAQTEVGETSEASEPGKGGSSTMPHKRNPVHCAALLAAGVRAPGMLATLYTAAVQEHERALGGWQAEWDTLPELVRLAGGSLRTAQPLVKGLQIDAKRMAENLAATKGLMLAEAVSLELGRKIGKDRAHALVEAAAKAAATPGRGFLEMLGEDPAITAHLSKDQLADLFQPENYIGLACSDTDAVLAKYASGHR